MADETTNEVQTQDEEVYKINLRVLPGIPPIYAQYVQINGSQDEVTISFFTAQPLLGGMDEIQEQVKNNGIVADCVARIVLAPARFEVAAQVLSKFAQEHMPKVTKKK